MNEYNYNFEVGTYLKMMESCFDDVVIKRYDDMGRIEKDSIRVNFIYGPKTRILQDIKGQPDTVKFPIIALTMNGMERDENRVKNKKEDIIYKVKGPNDSYVNIRAVPWNLSVELTMLAKYQQDIEQIIQNFAIFSNPYVVFSIREPRSGKDLRVEILWDGKMNLEYPTVGGELQNNVPYRMSATTHFTIKGWLFRTEMQPVKNICFIYDKIILSDQFGSCDYDQLTAYTANNETETVSISGIPQLRYLDKYYFKTTDTPTITVYGGGFQDIQNVYLSGSNPQMYPMTIQEAPDGTKFKGYALPNFSTPTPETLSFELPKAQAAGLADIIVVNKCGWSKLTKDANRCSRVENPYPNTVPEHYSWCVTQYPYLNGLIITSDLNDNGIIDTNEDIIYYEPDVIDKNAIIQQIKELMSLGDISVSDLG